MERHRFRINSKRSETDILRQVDFVEVARDCGIVSKGAAAKRYARMLQTHGILPHGGLVDPSRHAAKERSDSTPRVSKRRKLDSELPYVRYNGPQDSDHRLWRPPQSERQHYFRQEPPAGNFPPYMCRPMVPHSSPYLQRSLPRYMPNGMNQMTATMGHPTYQGMSDLPHNSKSMVPPQQTPFSIDQAMPQPSSEQILDADAFGDLLSHDFTDDLGLDNMPCADLALTNEFLDYCLPVSYAEAPVLQDSTNAASPDDHEPTKAEPVNLETLGSVHDMGVEEGTTPPQVESAASLQSPAVAALLTAATVPADSEAETELSKKTQPVEEGFLDGCTLSLD